MKNNLPYNVMANKVNSWDNVPRYNLVVPALATALGGSQLALIAANVIYAVGATLISSALYKALSPKPRQGLLTNIRDAAAPADIVYGQVRKGGVITYLESTGTDNKYLHMFITLAGHEVESIGDIYVNDKVASFSGNNITTATDGTDTDNWQSKIYVQKFTGASGQDIYTSLSGLSAKPSIDASFTGDDTACLYVRLTYDSDVFASGIPTITAVVKGKKVLNTSGVAQTYPASANAALVIRDYLTNYYGLDTPTSTIDDVSFAVAASDCDDDITLDAGGTEKRYAINGVVSAGQSIQQNLDELVAACGGSLFYSQGSFKLVAGVYSSSVKTLTLDDLRSPIQLSTKMSRRDNFNSVYGTFNDADQDWIEADFPPILSTGVGSFLEEDNGYNNPLDISLPLTTSAATAQRLAKLTLFRSREQMTFSAEFGMNAFDLEVGDTVSLTLARYGWTAKEFEVVEWGLKSDGEVGDLRVLLTLRETSSSAFDWSAEEAALTANNTSLPSATSTETVTFGATSVGSEVDTDGTTLPYIKFSWSVTNPSNVDYYDFQWKLTTDSDYNSVQTKETSFKLSPALSLVDYDYRIRSVNHLGVRSAFTTASAVTTVKDDTVPNVPTSVVVEGGYGSTKVTWTAPTTNTDASTLKDLGSYKIFRGTATNPTVQVGRVSGEVFTDTGLDDSQTYYYRIKAVDLSGNESAYSTNGSGTTSTAPIGETGARGAGRWNIGVTTLPTTSSGADSEFTSAIGDPVDKDQAWFYTGTESSPTGQSVWIYNLGTDTWTEQTEVIDGSLLVTETMTADKLVANQLLSGHSLKVGNISIDANAKPTSGAGMFVVGADDAGATGTTSGDVVFGSADEYVSWDTSQGTLSIKGELINVGDSFVNGRDATTYSCTNTTTDFDLVSNALDILGGAGTYGFIMTGAGGSGAVTDNQTTSDVCAATGGGAGGLALFVLDWNGTDTVTCSLGAGGSAITGVGSSSNGNSGGSSVFKVGGSTKVTCGGGSGGSYLFQTYGTANGGAGGTVTWADGNNGNTDFPKLAYSSTGGRGGNCYLTSGALDSQVSGGGGCHINLHSGISTSNGGDGNTNGQEMASSGGSAWGDGFRAETPSRYAHGPYKGTSGAESTSTTPPAETTVVPLFGIGGRSGYGSHQVPTDSSTAGDGGVFGGGGGALGGVPDGADAYGGNGGYGAGGGGAAAETIKESGAGGNGILYLWKIS